MSVTDLFQRFLAEGSRQAGAAAQSTRVAIITPHDNPVALATFNY